jgi:hypothetical protein
MMAANIGLNQPQHMISCLEDYSTHVASNKRHPIQKMLVKDCSVRQS